MFTLYGGLLILFYLMSLILYGTITHSGQEIKFVSEIVIAYNEQGTLYTNSHVIPVDCMVKEEILQVSTSTEFNTYIHVAVGSSLGANDDEISDNEADHYYVQTQLISGGQIEVTGENVPHYLFIEGNMTSSYQMRKGSGKVIEAGSYAQTRAYLYDGESTLTVGFLVITHILRLHVIAYRKGSNSYRKAGSDHCIALYDDSGIVRAGWVAPVESRLGNTRVVCFTNDGSFFVAVGKTVNINVDYPSADTEEDLMSGEATVIMTNGHSDGSSSCSTVFDKRTRFMRRGEVLGITADAPNGVYTFVFVYFTMIPNFDAQGSFAVELEDITESDQWDSYYVIPFDMYVTTVEIDWSASSIGYRGKLHVAHTSGIILDRTEGSEFTFGGNLLGDPEFINDARKQDFIIDTIPVVVNVVDSVSTANYGFDSRTSKVGRFMKQGDLVLFFKEDMSGSLTAWEFDVKLNYRSRVKGDFSKSFSYFSGNRVLDMNSGHMPEGGIA